MNNNSNNSDENDMNDISNKILLIELNNIKKEYSKVQSEKQLLQLRLQDNNSTITNLINDVYKTKLLIQKNTYTDVNNNDNIIKNEKTKESIIDQIISQSSKV